MLSKGRSKFIVSLQRKKIRDEEGLYVIEGDKLVREFLAAGVRLKMLVAKHEFIGSLPARHRELADEIEEVSYDDLKQVSSLKTPHNALAIAVMQEKQLSPEELQDNLCIALEFVQDPGNLGTIIRAAAWFGVRNVICSPDSVDVFNPKVIQASMGAILHVNVHYAGLREFLEKAGTRDVRVYGTVLDGEAVYSHPLGKTGIILFGNESKGISPELAPFVTDRIMIPGPGSLIPGIDSLNVGMAASVILSEFKRRSLQTGSSAV